MTYHQSHALLLDIMRRCRTRCDRARLHGDVSAVAFWSNLESFIASKDAQALKARELTNG